MCCGVWGCDSWCSVDGTGGVGSANRTIYDVVMLQWVRGLALTGEHRAWVLSLAWCGRERSDLELDVPEIAERLEVTEEQVREVLATYGYEG